MKKPVKKTVPFLDRVYRFLPIFLLLMASGNVYFVISFVRREKADFSDIRERAFLDVSNSYAFVETTLTNVIVDVRRSLSNEMTRVRFMNDIRFRPVNSSSTNYLDGVSSSDLSPSRVPRSTPVPARYFRMGGLAFLDFGSGVVCKVGDDFGFGVIDGIYPTGVVCGGSFYPYQQIQLKTEVVNNVLP